MTVFPPDKPSRTPTSHRRARPRLRPEARPGAGHLVLVSCESPAAPDPSTPAASASDSPGAALADVLAGAVLEAVERLHDVEDTATLWIELAAEAAALVPSAGAAVVSCRRGGWRVLGEHVSATSAGGEATAILGGTVRQTWLEFPGCHTDPASGGSRRSLLVADLRCPHRDPMRLVWWGSSPAALRAHQDVADTFGRHASLAVRAVVSRDTLGQAVEARHRIGLAQGILMSRYHLTAAQGFGLLHRLSLDSNVKLRTLAQSVIDTGELPGDRRPGR